jgi:class 3 adenylate cyclase/tetratricopeptide (TPR) repeat protein
MVTCQRCGSDSPEGFRFCGTCGAPLHQVAGREARKVVTVVFCDVTGWTKLSEGLDPEALRGIINRYFKEIRATIERHGGTVEKFIGDAVMAVFGIPRCHEDDALRAVRAASEIRERLPAVAQELGAELRFRTGMNTGTVFTGLGESLVIGDAVNVAARLEQAAQPGEILLGLETMRLVHDAVDVEPVEPLVLKGKSTPVSAFRLLDVHVAPAVDGFGWRPQSLVADAPAVSSEVARPMVGRDEELALAHAAFVRAAGSREMHLLTVLGDAGIGKSRLARELVEKLADEATALVGRCLSYGEGIAFWPLREALTQAAGGDSQDAIRGLLGDAQDADIVADIIAGALGLAAARSVGEQVPWAFRRLLEVLGDRGPVLLVIEDVHWAESPLLDLVDYLVDYLVAPVFVLCLARPELLNVRPRWAGGHPRVSSLLLRPLTDADAFALLGGQFGERRLSDKESTQIVRTAEGNPLFVEQILAMNDEDRRLRRDRQIPMTIQSLLAARLDGLGPRERAFIERAALIGREFPSAAVVELLPAETRASAAEDLHGLIRRGLIHPDRSPLAGGEQMRFHHILIRDVAYLSTPKALRSELHERFADWLAARDEAFDEFVGYHLEQAYRYRAEVGQLDAQVLSLAARAAESLAVAGRKALSRGDTNAAVKLLRGSADLVGASGRTRPDVLLDLGSALSESGDFPEAERALQAALEQALTTDAEAATSRARIELSYWRSHVDESVSAEELQAVAEQAIPVFDRLGDEGGLSRAWLHIALVHWIRSDCAAMEPALELALEHAERAGERRDRSRILSDLARTTVIGPLPVDEGIRRSHAILARAEGDVTATAFTQAMLAVLEAMDGRFDQARDRWQQSKRRLADVGLDVTVAIIQMYYVFIELLAGTPENAEAEVTEACAVFERIGTRGHLSSAAALAARVIGAQGRYEDGERYRRMSEETASADDVVSQVLWRGTHAKALAHSGDQRLAEDLANSAVALADGTDFLMMRGDALVDRAEVQASLGRPARAASDLEQAAALYERKGILGSADAARRAARALVADSAQSVAGPRRT